MIVATNDDRIIRETGRDAEVADIIAPVLCGLGYRLVRVRFFKNDAILQIMAERLVDGKITLENCKEISRELSLILDMKNPISDAYSLEISSPGLERPLVRKEDFLNFQGYQVKVETHVEFSGYKRFSGCIAGMEENGVAIDIKNKQQGKIERLAFPFEIIADIQLVFSDDLIRDTLKNSKKKKKENAESERNLSCKS